MRPPVTGVPHRSKSPGAGAPDRRRTRMLTQLAIRNVVLVERLELEFEPGLGVLTGETGAGKSILLDALGLALGARADSGLVRAGAGAGGGHRELRAAGRSSGHRGAAERTRHRGRARRTADRAPHVKADGGSRALRRTTSRSPPGCCASSAQMLVEIHGQHDDRGLLNPQGHRALLDAFGKLDSGRVAARWAEVTRIEATLAEARAELDAAERDRDYLEHAVRRDRRSSRPRRARRDARRASAPRCRRAAKAGRRSRRDSTSCSTDRTARWRSCARRRGRSSAVAADHPLLAEALAALDRAVIEASEAEDKIARRGRRLAFDPARLEQAEARLFDMRGAGAQASRRARRAGGAGAQNARAARDDRGGRASGSPRSSVELAEARAAYAKRRRRAERRARTAAAARLDAAVADELAPLKLDAARFRTVIAPLAEEHGAGGHRPRRVRGLDQPRRAVRAADQDRVGRRAVALHPRAQGRAGRGRRGARR